MKNMISWFEIPVASLERAYRFYSEILSVELTPFEVNGQKLAQFPGDEESVSGALILAEGYKPSREGTLIYLDAGDDLNIVLSRIEAAGGRILEGKIEVMKDRVYCAAFEDTEGNKVGLFSTK